MAKKSQRTIVGSPLTPTLLDELGALPDFPPSSEDFKPDGNWINTYRIWTCHGYHESGNENVGYLRIKRLIEPNDSLTLKVHQEILQADALVNIVEATIECRNNQLASLIQWKVSSRFIDADRQHISQLSSNYNDIAAEGSNRSTCDWSLFEAVQRLEFNRQISLNFDMLEGLSLLKKDHHLSYRGLYPTKIGGVNIPLHCFVQLGSGILPCEYCLDDHHRLLIVTSMNKAYIFDEQAEKISRQVTEKERKSYQKRKRSQRK
ncbi:MAG: hypothetical protein GY774_09365 [Planctomycetes bacterium]|nr:hypothetical protein [Planctomycetota bacterium]